MRTLPEPDRELDEVARDVIGAAIEVHRILGPGFLESVYEQALCVELDARGIPYRRQVRVAVSYKGRPICEHQLDLLVKDCLVVELKAGLLVNFQVRWLRDGIQRVILTR